MAFPMIGIAKKFGSAIVKYGGEFIDLVKIPFEFVGEVIDRSLDEIGNLIDAGFSNIHLGPIGDGLNWLLDRAGEKIHAHIDGELAFPDKFGRLVKDFFSKELFTDPGTCSKRWRAPAWMHRACRESSRMYSASWSSLPAG